ncbi:hypothetical protein DSM112329_00111 [Paraconexibacter sp. AEG42_29]|uniref:Calx-beta domain-containing protein n=1 Tax=Paraconexibacter sp. AEG42_29 TaxID=2997339 RepID=A0AAU7ANW1_9ACTN
MNALSRLLPAVLVLGSGLLASPAAAATYPVTTADASGPGSLGQAIAAANANPGADTVTFAIGAAGDKALLTITGAGLPQITGPLTIDGPSQGGGGAPLIRISGIPDGTNAIGLHVGPGAAGTVIRGVAVTRFNNGGIVIDAPDATVADSYIGESLGDSPVGVGNATGGIVVNADRATIRGNVIGDNHDRCGVVVTAGGGTVLEGNRVGTAPDGVTGVGNAGTCGVAVEGTATGTRIGGPGGGANVISGNDTNGIEIRGGSGTTVAGNRIGVGSDGQTVVSNKGAGILVTGGAPVIGDGNVISGNDHGGIRLMAPATIRGNLVGLAGNGVTIRSNGDYGVKVEGGAGTTIGGNIVSGNAGHGVWLTGTSVRDTVIAGNTIGLGSDGSEQRNTEQGVRLTGTGGNNVIGGRAAGARNVISGNDGPGVFLGGGDDRVEGNYIGTDAAGSASRGNADGVLLGGGGGTLGGTAAGAGNLISGNDGSGVRVVGGATGVRVLGNQIGGGAGGAIGQAANQRAQVVVETGTSGTVIGGPEAGAGNRVIEVNAGTGAIAVAATAGPTSVRGNVVTLNGDGQAIDNGPTGPDAGGSPSLDTVLTTGARTQVSGTAPAPAGRPVDVDVYVSDACNPVRRPILRYLGSGVAVAGADGIVRFNVPAAGAPGANEAVLVTTTPAGGSTSELSPCRGAGAAPTLQLAATAYSVAENGGAASITIERLGGGDGSAAIRVRTVDSTGRAGVDYTAVDRSVIVNAGETSVTVPIPVVDAPGSDADRAFDVIVSDPTAAVAGARDRATVAITNVKRAPVVPPPPPVALSAKLSSPIAKAKGKTLKSIRGTAKGTGLKRVQVAVTTQTGCLRLNSAGRLLKYRGKGCPSLFLNATGTTSWQLKLKRALPARRYTVTVRAVDAKGKVGKAVKSTLRVTF